MSKACKVSNARRLEFLFITEAFVDCVYLFHSDDSISALNRGLLDLFQESVSAQKAFEN